MYFPAWRQAQNAALEAQANTEVSERIKNLEQEVARHKEDSGKAQAEVDRLLEILREMENEKNDKDKKINELERWVDPQTPPCLNGCLSAYSEVVDSQFFFYVLNSQIGLLSLFYDFFGFIFNFGRSHLTFYDAVYHLQQHRSDIFKSILCVCSCSCLIPSVFCFF